MIAKVGAIRSPDGTTVSYRTIGQGPPLVVIPGALADAADLAAFAGELAPSFTVHTVDRRGRGASGPQGPDYSIARECEDIRALLAETGARHLFGHSFGGLVALEAARALPELKHLAVYEPGVSIDGSVPMDWAPRSRELLARGRAFDAFVAFARGMNPEATGKLPAWLLKGILLLVMRREERRKKSRLMPEAIREHAEVARLDNTYSQYREIAAPVLLLVGGRGAASTGADRTAATLATVMAGAMVITLPGLDHFGPERHPRRVARAMLEQFEHA